MKKQADNLLNSLEVISGRLSQLELYCYKLERSIGELRSDVMDYHGEANLSYRCLEKHVKEVRLVFTLKYYFAVFNLALSYDALP
jgi:predicted secreted Zn-dependent protease